MECMRTVASLLAALVLSGQAVAQRSGIDVTGYWFMVTPRFGARDPRHRIDAFRAARHRG